MASRRVTTQNMTGTTIILTRAMNQSLSGLIAVPTSGPGQPRAMPEDGADQHLNPQLADQ